MSLALLFAGVLFLAAAVRDKQGDLFALLAGDFTGTNNFLEWILALVLVGAIGYIPKMRPFSTAMIALILVAIFLRKGTGFFGQLTAAVNATAKGKSA